ncbi:MAG: DUF11 domain-containing protein [Bacteroidetes bacterium]|nr:DUF11 domain-containing protein [Bacteroidota bacterium]
MKVLSTLRIISLLLFFNTNLFAQYFWVPDSIFRNSLIQQCPACFTANDSLIIYNADSLSYVISAISVTQMGINDISGIEYFAHLYLLQCASNNLTSITAFPADLVNLQCGDNNLTSLPPLPNGLRELYIFRNSLDSLPANLPDSLSILEFWDNQIQVVPPLPPYLTRLSCSNNLFSELPPLPATLERLECAFNYNLHCLPPLPQALNYLYVVATSVPCIPNIPAQLDTNGLFLAMCSPFANSCSFPLLQEGYVYLDTNANQTLDPGEKGVQARLNYGNGYFSVLTDTSGHFVIPCDTGNVTLDLVLPNYYISSGSASQSFFVQPGLSFPAYFGIAGASAINDLTVDLTPVTFIRPGFKVRYNLHYENIGTQSTTATTLKYVKPTNLFNLSTNPPFNSISGDTLIWNIGTLEAFKGGTISIIDSVSTAAVLGDTATAFAFISPLVGDTTPQNNSSVSLCIIRGSFDPNDKAVSPETMIPGATGFLEYTIRFQNTGTDTAFTVYVTDTLSSYLNSSSIEIISASHTYSFLLDNGIAKWHFANILLPDSNVNEASSHGFVKFKIKPQANLAAGVQIPNAANIYFDYNTAVVTNTIVVDVTPLSVPLIADEKLQLFPNPVHQMVHLKGSNSKPLGKVTLVNSEGKIIESKTISSSTYEWHVEQLPAGIYIFKGENWKEKILKK